MRIDLNAARAARREGKGDTLEVVLDAETFIFPVEFPMSLVDLTATAIEENWPEDRYVRTQIEHLMGEDGWQPFLGLNPSRNDFNALYDEVMGAYGIGRGESNSSP